jgi:hypothetical protein
VTAVDAGARERVRRILLLDWDPHDVMKRAEAHGAYDAWVGPLCEFVAGGADEAAVVAWLHERELETMCFPSLGTARLNRVARLLVGAVRGE